MKRNVLNLNKILPFVLFAISFFVFIMATSPNTVPLPLLVVPFIVIGFFIYFFVKAVVQGTKTPRDGISVKLLALSISSLAVLLLLLQSLDQLTLRDGLLTTIFATMFWVYIWKADFLGK